MTPSREVIKRGRNASVATAGSGGLLPESELRAIVDNVLRLAKSTAADETEVHVDEVDDSLTRFANNTIHQNVAERGLSVSVRTVFDGRTARATTNKVDDDSLRRVIAASSALARSQPKDPALLPMPGPQKYARVQRYFASTAAATPEDRARAVARICKLAAAKKQTSAGIFSTAAGTMLLANSRGLFAEYRHTHAECSV